VVRDLVAASMGQHEWAGVGGDHNGGMCGVDKPSSRSHPPQFCLSTRVRVVP